MLVLLGLHHHRGVGGEAVSKRMSDVLTQEEYAGMIHPFCEAEKSLLLAHDAALRSEIERLAKDLASALGNRWTVVEILRIEEEASALAKVFGAETYQDIVKNLTAEIERLNGELKKAGKYASPVYQEEFQKAGMEAAQEEIERRVKAEADNAHLRAALEDLMALYEASPGRDPVFIQKAREALPPVRPRLK